MPRLAIVVAMTKDRVIGTDKGLPWHLPAELLLFKRLTMGGTVVMGYNTFKAIGHPLRGRHNIVLSRNHIELPDVQVCNSFIAGLQAAAQTARPVFVIGGAEVYRKALPLAAELHVSWIKGTYRGNHFFPGFDLSAWRICAEEPHPDFHYAHYLRSSD